MEARSEARSNAGWKRLLATCLLCAPIYCSSVQSAAAAEAPQASKQAEPADMKKVLADRKDLFDKVSALTGIPWYYLAGIDQYERTIGLVKKRPPRNGLISIYFTEQQWCGMMNPDHEDTDVKSIMLFNGIGRDGSGDGLADRNN